METKKELTYIQFSILWEQFIEDKCITGKEFKHSGSGIYKEFLNNFNDISIGIKKFNNYCRQWCHGKNGDFILENYKTRSHASGNMFHGLKLKGIKDEIKENTTAYIQKWKREEKERKGDTRKNSRKDLGKDDWLITKMKKDMAGGKLPPLKFLDSIKSGEIEISKEDKAFIIDKYESLKKQGVKEIKEIKEEERKPNISELPDDSLDWDDFVNIKHNELKVDLVEKWLSNFQIRKQKMSTDNNIDQVSEAHRMMQEYGPKTDINYQLILTKLYAEIPNSEPSESENLNNGKNIAKDLPLDPSNWPSRRNEISLNKIEKWLKNFDQTYRKQMEPEQILELLKSARDFIQDCTHITAAEKASIFDALQKMNDSVDLLDKSKRCVNVETVNSTGITTTKLDKDFEEFTVNFKKPLKNDFSSIKTKVLNDFKTAFFGINENRYSRILALNEKKFDKYITKYNGNKNFNQIKEALEKFIEIIFVRNEREFWKASVKK